MNNILLIAKNNFHNMVRNMIIFDNRIIQELFNPKRKKISNKLEKYFEGNNNCGLASYILGYYYKDYDVKMIRSAIGYGKYYEDHCYLQIDDIIIDPTIRQFLDDYRDDGNSNYLKYIYDKKDPIFVGTKKELNDHLEYLDYLNKNTFGNSILNLNELKLFWRGNEDYSYKLNELFEYVENKRKPTDLHNSRLILSLLKEN